MPLNSLRVRSHHSATRLRLKSTEALCRGREGLVGWRFDDPELSLCDLRSAEGLSRVSCPVFRLKYSHSRPSSLILVIQGYGRSSFWS